MTGSDYRYDGQTRAMARGLWQLLDTIHVPVYFADEVKQASMALGLSNRMMSYCAIRSAPFGQVPPEVVHAAFYGFAPRAIASGLPAAWEATTPAAVTAMTHEAMGGLLDRLFEGLDDEVALAAELARAAALLHPTIGRPLAAAWSTVPWSDQPSVQLWQAATRIRESRGDGHVALLLAADIDGVGSHLAVTGDHPKLRPHLTTMRGWTEPEIDAGVATLRDRGIIGADGWLTEQGTALRDHLEAATDDLAAGPWQQLGIEASQRLAETLRPLARRVVDAQILPGFAVKLLGKALD